MDSEHRVENGLPRNPKLSPSIRHSRCRKGCLVHESRPSPLLVCLYVEPLFHNGSLSLSRSQCIAPLSFPLVPLSLSLSLSYVPLEESTTCWQGLRRRPATGESAALPVRSNRRSPRGEPAPVEPWPELPLHSRFLHLTRGGRTLPAAGSAICTSVSYDTRDKWCAAAALLHTTPDTKTVIAYVGRITGEKEDREGEREKERKGEKEKGREGRGVRAKENKTFLRIHSCVRA